MSISDCPGVPVARIIRAIRLVGAVLLLSALAGVGHASQWFWQKKAKKQETPRTTADTSRTGRVLTTRYRPPSPTSSSLSLTSPTLSPADFGTSAPVEPEDDLPYPHWKELQPSASPSPRFRPLMDYEADRQRTLLFGGFGDGNQYSNETWEFDGRTWRRLDIPSPPADPGYMLAYDIYRGAAVLYGGRSRDTWEFDGSRWSRVKCEHRPPIIGSGAMAYDSTRRVTVLFGGEVASTGDSVLPTLCSETWQYDGHDWTKADVKGPSARKYHQMVYDSARERFVLFGGFDTKPLRDTWELRSAGWRRVETRDAPSARRGLALTYDPNGRRTLLFGGLPGGDELWAFDGTQWSQVRAPKAPPYREGAGLVFMPTSRRVLLFGGLSSKLLNDSWVFIAPAATRPVMLPPPAVEEIPREDWLTPAGRIRLSESVPPVLEIPKIGTEADLPDTTGASVPEAMMPTVIPTTKTLPLGPPSQPITAPVAAGTTATEPLAELHFENVKLAKFTPKPNEVISFDGYLVNSGNADARCWVEFWLTPSRDPYIRRRLLCRPTSVKLKAGQRYRLAGPFRLLDAPLPEGKYYVALEVDHQNQVKELDETNNIFITDTLVTVPGSR
jgi:hypothetical protein